MTSLSAFIAESLSAATAAPPPLCLAWQHDAPQPLPGKGVAGVFVLWRVSRAGRECLVVGEAHDIAEDLSRALRGGHVAALAALNALEISWAAVASLHRAGVAGWLGTALLPTHGLTANAARPIPVNLPF